MNLRTELGEYFRRAERHSDRKGPLRREAFRRLLDLAREDNVSGKLMLAEKAHDFFTDFPEYQDEAINALYDMCEGQNHEIRMAGYSSLTTISKSMIKLDRAWVRQNADVLVQLLQSDDDREVATVKRALQEHVDLDPLGTIGILCDQCIVNVEEIDEDEASIRERIRALVLQFLAEKFRVCIARVAEKQEVEDALLKGLMCAIPNCSETELRLITEDIFRNLPSVTTNKGNVRCDILNLLLARSKIRIETHNYDAALSVLTLASTFCLYFYSRGPSDSRQKRSISTSNGNASPGTDIATQFLKFYDNDTTFHDLPQESRGQLVVLSCDVYENSRDTWKSSERESVFVAVAPRLLKLVKFGDQSCHEVFTLELQLRLLRLISHIVEERNGVELPSDLTNTLLSAEAPQIVDDHSLMEVDGRQAALQLQVQSLSRDISTKLQGVNDTKAGMLRIKGQRSNVANGSTTPGPTSQTSTADGANMPRSVAPAATSTNTNSRLSGPLAAVTPSQNITIRGISGKRGRDDTTIDSKPKPNGIMSPISKRPRKSLPPVAAESNSLINRMGLAPQIETLGVQGLKVQKGLNKDRNANGLLSRLSISTHDDARDVANGNGRARQIKDTGAAALTSDTANPQPSNELQIRGAARRTTTKRDEPLRPSSNLIDRLASR